MLIRWLLCLLCCLLFSVPLKAEVVEPKVHVVSSIKPVQLMVAAIGGDKVQAELLLPATVSPHLYQLRPSDRRSLANADAIFWVGPDLERFLVKPLALLSEGKAVALQDSLVTNNQHDHQEHVGHHHHNGDPHSWLDPIKAIDMAARIADTLSKLDQDNKVYYQANLTAFSDNLRLLDEELQHLFKGSELGGYLVLHDAYNHFEQRYGLEHQVAVLINPDRQPGVKRLLAIQQLLTSKQVSCVFTEPQFQQTAFNKLLADAKVTQAVLDPLAIEAQVGRDGYLQFMRVFGQTFYQCLQSAGLPAR